MLFAALDFTWFHFGFILVSLGFWRLAWGFWLSGFGFTWPLAFGFWFLFFWLLVLASLGSSLGSWLLPSGFWFFDFTWLVVLFSPVFFFTWIEIDRDRHT